jgi:hypothetical protein
MGTPTRTYNGNAVRTISGHRDVGSTACPGLIRNNMWWIRQEAAKATTWTSGEPNGRPPSAPAPEPSPEPSPSPSPSPSPTATPAEPEPLPDDERFLDVAANSVHRDNVLIVHDTSVLLGYTKTNRFEPDVALNRGDMARAVARGLGLKPNWDWRSYFPNDADYQSKDWLGPWIAALVDAEVVGGYPDGTYRPSEPLSRGQMATFLARSLDLTPAEPSFVDVSPTSVHRRAIGAVEKAGVTAGITKTEFGPGLSMRRDQAATLLVRAYNLRR